MCYRLLIPLFLCPFLLRGADLTGFDVGGTAANKVVLATVLLPGDGGLLVEAGISGANSSSLYRLGFRLSNGEGDAVDLILKDVGGATISSTMSGGVIYSPSVTPALGTINANYRLAPPLDLALNDYQVTVLLEYYDGKDWIAESLNNLSPVSSLFELRVFPEGSDSQRNVKLHVDTLTLDRKVVFSGFAGLDAYPCTLDVRALRYDEDSSFSTSVTALVSAVFVEADGVTEVPAEISIDNVSFSSETSVGLSGINPLSGAGVPSTHTFSQMVYVRPSGSLTVGSEQTTVRFTIRHNDYVGFGIVMAVAPVADVTERLFASDGSFMSGAMAVDFDAIGSISSVSVSGETATVQVTGTALSLATGHGYTGSAVLSFTGSQVPVLLSTLVLTAPSSPDEATVNGVLMRRGTVALTPTGPQMSGGEVRLPRGLGYTLMDAEYGYGSNVAKGWMKIVGNSTGVVSLNGDLEPSQSELSLHPFNSSSAAAAVEIALNEESKPFVWITDAVTWAPSSGVVTWAALKVRSIHDDEWDILEETAAAIPSGLGVFPSLWLQKRDNRSYLREPDIPAATAEVPNPENVIVATALAGDARLFAQLSLSVPNGGSAYSVYPQFPAGSLVSWTNTGVGGQLTVSNDVAFGELAGIASVLQLYNPSGIDGDCFGATSKTLITELPAGEQTLTITADGGLLSPALHFHSTSATRLEIGVTEDEGGNPVAVHTVEGWTNDSMDYLMAGVSLSGASGWHTGNTSSELGVSTLLNTGFGRNENGTLFTERPGTTAYAAGDASYAGLNFREAAASGAVTGFTYLGDSRIPESGSYGLRNNSKYYVRLGGVSGAHDVDFTSHGGVYPVYGYELDFYRFGLAYLNNLNAEYGLDSTVAADLEFTSAPLSGFGLAFDSMSVTGNGDLESGDLIVDGADPKEPLSYWGGSAIPGSFAFNPSLADACAKERLLVLGVETYAALIDSPLHGYLAIASSTTPGGYSNGSLVSLKDGEAFGARPRVFLPGLVQMRGPAQIVGGETTYEVYPIRPVADAYFNNYDTPSRPASGFMAFGATMGVSFFEDLKIHVRMPAANAPDSGLADTTAVYLSGGWNSGGDTFWSHPEGDDFDKEHKGWDGDFNAYWTENHESAAYDIRAEQDLFGLIEISYPVQWNPTLRQFTGNKQAVDLIVLNANHKLDFLTAERASITFGVKAELEGIPNINLGTLAMNATGAADGLLATLSQTASAQVGLILDKGSGALNQLLADVPEELFSQTWEAVIAPRLSGLDISSIPNFAMIDDIALQLDTAVEYTTDVEDALKGYFLPDGETWFFNVATEAMQAIDEGGSVIRKIDSSLAEVQNGIRAVSSFSVDNLSAESLWEGTVETLQSDGTILILNWDDLKEKAITDFE